MFKRKLSKLTNTIEELQEGLVTTIWLHITTTSEVDQPTVRMVDLVEKHEYRALLWGMAEAAAQVIGVRDSQTAKALLKVLGDGEYFGRCAIAGEDPRYVDWRAKGSAVAIAVVHRRERPREAFWNIAGALCSA
jgi:hypothetical protein